MSERTILHVDMDAFYAAVEQRDNPSLRGKPVIVGADPKGGRGRGIVATCSYEARHYGVHSAQPISRAWSLCPQGIYVLPDMGKYERVSRLVMSIFLRFTEMVEPVSIDEAFLDVTGSRRLHGSGEQISRSIKHAIRAELRLTASVGVATNKFIAKVASDLEKPDGLVIVPPGEEKEFLRPLPVSRLWGVGAKTGQLLGRMGIGKIGELAAADRALLQKRLGKHGEHLWSLAQGLDDRPVSPEEGYKSIGHEHTFERDTADPGILASTLLDLAERVAMRLRANRVRACTITVKLRESDFTTATRRTTLDDPVDTCERIYPLAQRLMRSLARDGKLVRLLGVYASNLSSDDSGQQLGLFDGNEKRTRELAAAMDSIADRYGTSAIRRAALVPHPAGRVGSPPSEEAAGRDGRKPKKR